LLATKVLQLEKPKKQRTRRELLLAILDRRLYGRSFFGNSVPFLIVIFAIQMTIYISLNSWMLYLYTPLFFMLVFVSGFGSKNMSSRKRETHSMGQFRIFLFSFISVMASAAPFTISQPSDPVLATGQYLLLYGISTLALTLAVTEITIYGQRLSLRRSMRLTADFFKNQKKAWAEKLVGFPNSDNIVKCIDGTSAVTEAFDHGSFGLALLWSWAVMERTLEAVAEGAISRDPTKREIFRHKNDYPRTAIDQLENLGFDPDLSQVRDDEKKSLKDLYSARNDFAHRSVLPSFQQTFRAMATLKSFVEEMPEILQGLKVGAPAQNRA
jgi:hypothetical protein